MATRVQAPLETLTFDGRPTEDVTLFLRDVQKIAFAQGRQTDDDWKVQYTETCLVGEALRWFSGLDDEPLRSWRNLRLAFLERFESTTLAPEPPAAPPGPGARPRVPMSTISYKGSAPRPPLASAPAIWQTSARRVSTGPTRIQLVPAAVQSLAVLKVVLAGDDGDAFRILSNRPQHCFNQNDDLTVLAKASLLNRFITGIHTEQAITHGAVTRTSLQVDGADRIAEIFNNDGGVRGDDLEHIFRRDAATSFGVMLCYSTTDRQSLESIRAIHADIKNHTGGLVVHFIRVRIGLSPAMGTRREAFVLAEELGVPSVTEVYPNCHQEIVREPFMTLFR